MKNNCLEFVIICLMAFASLVSCADKERCEDCVPYDWKVAESVECSDVDCDIQIYDGASCNVFSGNLSVDYIAEYSVNLRLDLNVPDAGIWHLSVESIDVSGEVGIVYLKPAAVLVSCSSGTESAVNKREFEVDGYLRCANIAELILSQDSHPKAMSGCITLSDKKNKDTPCRLVISNLRGEF